MTTTTINQLAEKTFPFEFLLEKRITDAKRLGFVAGINYKGKKDIATISFSEVCMLAKLLYDKRSIFIVTKMNKSLGYQRYTLTGTGLKVTLAIVVYSNGEIEMLIDGANISTTSLATLEAYEFLKQCGYAIN